MRRCGRWCVLGALLIFGGCGEGGLSLGLSGCEGDMTPFEPTPQNTIEHGIHTAITQKGFEFIFGLRLILAQLLFGLEPGDSEVVLPLPPFEFDVLNGGIALGIRDVEATFNLAQVQIGLEFLANPTRMRLTLDDVRLGISSGVIYGNIGGGDAACQLENGLPADPPKQAALLEGDFAIDLILVVDEQARFVPRVEVLPFTIDAFDAELSYDRNLPECGLFDCRIVCGLGDLGLALTEALYSAFDDQLNEVIQPVSEAFINALLARVLGQPLAIEGEIHPRILADLLPTASDAHPIKFRVGPTPEGFTIRTSEGGKGLGLTTDVGLDSILHPCIPGAVGEPFLEAGPAPSLDGVGRDGSAYHLGLAVSDAVVNRAVWAAYRGGALCVALDSDQIAALLGQRVDTSTLALLLPGLRTLTGGPRPIRVALDPVFRPEDFPVARFRPAPNEGGLPQARLDVLLPEVGISFYAQIEERWSRLFQIRTSIEVGLVVQATPDNRLRLAVDTPKIGDIEQVYNELLEGAEIEALLDVLVGLVTNALLKDGLTLDVGLGGLVQAISGLPVEARIKALEVEGEADDFLTIQLFLGLAFGQSLSVAVDTRAQVVMVDPGRVVLDVDAPGVDQAQYQWRLDGGPWHPLKAAVDGQIVVADPGLQILGLHRIAIRAVDSADYQTLDPTPVVRPVQIKMGAPPAQATPKSGGCQAGGDAPGGVLLVLFLLLPLWRRAIGPLIVIAALGGCEDKRRAAPAYCEHTRDCPGGLVCLTGTCQRPFGCQSSTECCPGAECLAGACVPQEAVCAADSECLDPLKICVAGQCERIGCAAGCPTGECVGNYCHVDLPCQGRCEAEQVCFAAFDECRTAPARCAECPPGLMRVAQDTDGLGAECDLAAIDCECVRTLPIRPADFGRHASMGLILNVPVFAAYDADFGDLVYVEGVEAGTPTITYLDGIPEVAPQADPDGPRGGVTQPGPDRGRYARIAIDVKGRPHIAYYDADEGDLRYIRGDGRGGFTVPVVVDRDGDVGRYPRIAIGQTGAVHIIYAVVQTPSGRSGLRYAVSNVDSPIDGDFEIVDVSLRPTPPGGALPPGLTPQVHGVMPCMRLSANGLIYAAFYDGEEQWPYLVRGDVNGFAVHRLDGALADSWPPDPGGRYARFEAHDLGRFCDLVVDGESPVEVAFVDDDTDALLMYRGPVEGRGVFEIIDPGGRGLRRLVGSDPSLAVDPQHRLIAVYQDATTNDVLLTVRSLDGWPVTPIAAATAGALGFYNSLLISAGEAVIGTLELKTLPGGRGSNQLHVFRLPIPRF